MNRKIIICGAGIAGLCAALFLHHRGFKNINILESSLDIKPKGSGINIMPSAVKELAALGLLKKLLIISISTRELFYMNTMGQEIWYEKRGLFAGYNWPQISIHRGWLQITLLNLVIEKMGKSVLKTGIKVTHVDAEHGEIHYIERNQKKHSKKRADLIIAADGIRSALRQSLIPNTPPVSNGMIIYRGISWRKPFLTDESMVIMGDDINKFVLYPMARKGGESLLNWAAAAKEDRQNNFIHGDWNQSTSYHDFAHLFHNWNAFGISPYDIIRNTHEIFTYPMVDIESLENWSFNNKVILIGDAAHAMYPIGSNGATQSIIDASALAYYLKKHTEQKVALSYFEHDRRENLSKIQISNRHKGPEEIINIVNKLAPNGFDNITDIIPKKELKIIIDNYTSLTSMSVDVVNNDMAYASLN